MSKNELFKKLYNELEIALNHKYKHTDRNFSVVKKFENDSKEPFRSKIRLLREMRNLLVHQDSISLFPSFEVSDESIDFLKSQIEYVKNPLTAYDICVKINNVMYASLESNILDLIKNMNKTHYSHVPVLDKKEKVIGVFSENSIFNLVDVLNGKLNLDSSCTIKDYQEYISIHNHRSEDYLFVSKSIELSDLEKLFLRDDVNQKKIVMLFVTNHGKENEKILGIITPFDLIGK